MTLEEEIKELQAQISKLKKLRNSGKLTDAFWEDATRRISNYKSEKAVLIKRQKGGK